MSEASSPLPLAPPTATPMAAATRALRTSSYTIYVDLPANPDDMLLVHGYSGAYDRVSRRVATYLRSLESGRPPRPLFGAWSPEPPIDGQVVAPGEATIARLQQRGYLTERSHEEEVSCFSGIAEKLHRLNNRPSYIFMPTYDCNLRCSYCFQDHMRTDPHYQHLLRTMRPAIVDRIFAAFPQLEEQHGLVPGPQWRSTMGFFGGEPLLERSRRIVEYIVQKAQAEGETTFWAITNGTELEAYRALLNPRRINWLQITLDGPPAEHDRRRIYADGRGSFDQIARNLTMALDQGVGVSVRMNVDRHNLDQLPALADEIVARGWDRYPLFSAYTATIHAANDQTDIRTTFTSWDLDRGLNRLREQYPNMAIIARPDDRLADQVQAIFQSQQRPALKSSYCGAHSGMYLFDVFGDIYACWERTGDPSIRIGAIDASGQVTRDEQLTARWRGRTVTTNPTCRQCRYALYCGGGCAVLAENHRGEFFTNFCDGFAARFRASVAEAYQHHTAGRELTVLASPGCDQ